MTLVLAMGAHDSNYVDADYGPDSLRTTALAESLSVARIKGSADSLIMILGETNTPPYSDSLVRLRHEQLRTQLEALSARAGMLGGQKLSSPRSTHDPAWTGDTVFRTAPGEATLDRQLGDHRARLGVSQGTAASIM